jgi:hypothetical protein
VPATKNNLFSVANKNRQKMIKYYYFGGPHFDGQKNLPKILLFLAAKNNPAK